MNLKDIRKRTRLLALDIIYDRILRRRKIKAWRAFYRGSQWTDDQIARFARKG